MIRIAKKLWGDLRDEIGTSNYLSRLDLVLLIKKTLTKYKSEFSQELFDKYPIFHFILRDDIVDYIVESAPRNDDFSSVNRIFMEVKPSSDASAVSLISEIVRGMVEFKTRHECPSCSDDELVAMFDSDREEVLLVCNICGWVQDLNGMEVKKITGYLLPVKKLILKRSGLLE